MQGLLDKQQKQAKILCCVLFFAISTQPREAMVPAYHVWQQENGPEHATDARVDPCSSTARCILYTFTYLRNQHSTLGAARQQCDVALHPRPSSFLQKNITSCSSTGPKVDRWLPTAPVSQVVSRQTTILQPDWATWHQMVPSKMAVHWCDT